MCFTKDDRPIGNTTLKQVNK